MASRSALVRVRWVSVAAGAGPAGGAPGAGAGASASCCARLAATSVCLYSSRVRLTASDCGGRVGWAGAGGDSGGRQVPAASWREVAERKAVPAAAAPGPAWPRRSSRKRAWSAAPPPRCWGTRWLQAGCGGWAAPRPRARRPRRAACPASAGGAGAARRAAGWCLRYMSSGAGCAACGGWAAR